ncbi:MAG TPA: outer membrane beta-barrel protein, partial [Longimicrobiales bacterium]|nr:outer membrane beta-barrel protein [Longimicrobiales bacterium]
ALLVPLVAAPASAQSWKFDWGVNGGYSYFTDFLGSDETGTDEGVTFEPGWLLGTQLTYWASPRIGIRANGTYSDREIDPGTEGYGHVNLWSASGDLLFRFSTPNEDWMGSEFLPYLALGAGMKFINGAGGLPCVSGDDDYDCHPLAPTGEYALGDKNVFMGLVGLGADWRMSPNFALRLEVSDRIYKPHVERVTGLGGGGVTLADESSAKVMHEIAGQIGLHLLMGLARPEVVAVAPPPPPPPPPAPEPPPPPREDAITVCVIDPTAPNGIRMQNALFLQASGDTVIVVNGTRTPLRQAVGTVQVARTADWYVRGEPLTLQVGRYQTQYLTYQGARQIEADRLTFLGTINGYPVYADRDQVADVNVQLAELRTSRNSNDLAAILANRNDVRGELEDVKFLYVPLEPTGCVFQTVQMLEQVRKGK